MMDVSVYCTVRNGADNIDSMIKSVLVQTHKQWELVIVDDGSNDKTIELIEGYSVADRRIKLIKTTGVGRAKALNLAIGKCKYDIVCNLDADDVFFKRKIELQLKEMENDLFLCSKSIIFNKDEDVMSYYECDMDALSLDIVDDLHLYNKVNHSSIMFNKSILSKSGFYNESLSSNIDYELWLRMFSLDVKFLISEEALVGKRIHENQSFENKKRFKYLTNDLKIKLKFINENNLPLVDKINVILRYFYGFLPSKLRMIVRSLYF